MYNKNRFQFLTPAQINRLQGCLGWQILLVHEQCDM